MSKKITSIIVTNQRLRDFFRLFYKYILTLLEKKNEGSKYQKDSRR